MNKTKFFRHYAMANYFESHIWDCWYDYWQKTGREDSYPPDILGFNVIGDMLSIKFNGGEERIPLEEFYHVDVEPFRMLWHVNYWDGPLSGVCDRGDKKYWFETHTMEHDEPYLRQYEVFELSADDMLKEHYWHTMWLICIKGGQDMDLWYNTILKDMPIRNYTTRDPIGVFDEYHFVPIKRN